MKLHLPLSLRSALLVTVAALSSYPSTQAEEVSISSDTLYQYATVFSKGSSSYIGAGDTPTYTLTFEALICYKENTSPPVVDYCTQGFALVGDELSFSNLKTLEFKHHRFRSTWYEWGGGVLGGSGSNYNLWGGSVINAGMADSISEEANSPQACVVNITGNGNVLFRDNKSYNGGGAVAIKNTELTIQDNKS
ncbi:MAG: hypothetical protein IJB31_01915, partial [Akkermansia sp.]|nr:hypothetical protein [Akkermansia sp.]